MKNNISIYFGKKDIDLLSWINLIPKGKYPYYIKQALLAKINNEDIFLGKVVINNNLQPIRKNFNINCDKINNFLDNVPNSLRSNYIKNILRTYIDFTLKINEDEDFIPSIILPSKNIKFMSIQEDVKSNNIQILDHEKEVYTDIKEEDMEEQSNIKENAYNLLDNMISI